MVATGVVVAVIVAVPITVEDATGVSVAIVAVAVAVAVLKGVEVAVTVGVAVACVHTALFRATLLVSRVTAPVRAYRPPCVVAPVVRVIEAIARIFP